MELLQAGSSCTAAAGAGGGVDGGSWRWDRAPLAVLRRPIPKNCRTPTQLASSWQSLPHSRAKKMISVAAAASGSSHEGRATAGSEGVVKGSEKLSGHGKKRQSSAQQQQQAHASPAPTPPPPPSYPGTPLFWVGVGVALAVFFNWASKKVMQQAQAAMMRQLMESMKTGAPPGGFGAGPGGFGASPGGFGAGPGGFGASPGGVPFSGMPPPPFPPFPMPPGTSTSSPTTSGSGAQSSPLPTQDPGQGSPGKGVVDVSAKTSGTNGSATPPRSPSSTSSSSSSQSPFRDQTTGAQDKANSGYSTAPLPTSAAADADAASRTQENSTTPTATPTSVIEPDMEAEQPKKRSSFFQDTDVTTESTGEFSGGYSWNTSTNQQQQSAGAGQGRMTVEALERMLDDPTIQKMILPYLPEELRDPATFKWLLQNPTYRSQLETMLEGGSGQGFDPRVLDMMKQFDLQSPEVQQQFSQMGMTPEQVVQRVMGDPQLAAAFQNPRIQAAILDVSSNPYNIAKYANDAEFMEVFQKMQQVFPSPPGMN